MSPYREPTPADWKKTLFYISVAVIFICISAVLLVYRFPPLGLVTWLVVCVGGALVFLVRWHAQSTAYRCPACGNEFVISALVDFLSPHILHKKYLKCPGCGKRNWAAVLFKHS